MFSIPSVYEFVLFISGGLLYALLSHFLRVGRGYLLLTETVARTVLMVDICGKVIISNMEHLSRAEQADSEKIIAESRNNFLVFIRGSIPKVYRKSIDLTTWENAVIEANKIIQSINRERN